MDVYFSRMRELTKSPNVAARMQFILQDVIELRERKWVPRSAMPAQSLAHESTTSHHSHDYSVDLEPTDTFMMTSGDNSDALSMPETKIKEWISDNLEIFFNGLTINEAEVYVARVPVGHRHLLIDKLVARAIEWKETDAQLVAELFSRAVSKNLASLAMFERGFMPTAKMLDDIVIDAPKAFHLFAIVIKGAGLDQDAKRCMRIVSKSMNSVKLLELLPQLTTSQAGSGAATPPQPFVSVDIRSEILTKIEYLFAHKDLDRAENTFLDTRMKHSQIFARLLVNKALESQSLDDADFVANLFQRVLNQHIMQPSILQRVLSQKRQMLARMAEGAGLDWNEGW